MEWQLTMRRHYTVTAEELPATETVAAAMVCDTWLAFVAGSLGTFASVAAGLGSVVDVTAGLDSVVDVAGRATWTDRIVRVLSTPLKAEHLG